MKEFIATRIRQERERKGLTQQELASLVGWEGHQTIQQIESAKRELKAWELVKIANALNVELYSLLPKEDKEEPTAQSKPYVLWREKPQHYSELIESYFLKQCEDLHFVENLVEARPLTADQLPHFDIKIEDVSFVEVHTLAELTRKMLDLGAFPARNLVPTLEYRFNVKFFSYEAEDRGSAASVRGEFGDCVLVNSNEPAWRQNFSVAHELFHLVTWDEGLFQQLENNEVLRDRNEQLANAFAAALLMPSETLLAQVRRLTIDGNLRYAAFVALAREFEVSLPALLWRLHHLNFLSRKEVERLLKDEVLQVLDRHSKYQQTKTANSPVRALGSKFARTAYLAYQYGKISRARLARMLSVPLVELSNHLRDLGLTEVGDNAVKVSNS